MSEFLVGAGIRGPGAVEFPSGTVSMMSGEQAAAGLQRFADRLKAKWDAAQTVLGNQEHWKQADKLDPHTAANLRVRAALRSRSRYEFQENNPLLKGAVLSLANDFVGSGPNLRIEDERYDKTQVKKIQSEWKDWFRTTKMRQKLWRLRLAKIVDGESFLFVFRDRRADDPMELNFFVVECDRVSTNDMSPRVNPGTRFAEIDGVRFDQYDRPVSYHLLHQHPGGSILRNILKGAQSGGQWVSERFVVHWFRQDRGWVRGIPEGAPSLPLCAILRRYVMAIARNADTNASFTGFLETQAPPGGPAMSDGSGNILEDEPFDAWPIEMGMIATLPWGYKWSQANPVPFGEQFEFFIGSLVREIMRPIHVPFNLAIGTSKDSNMATSVVDVHMYKMGHKLERISCEEDVLDPVFNLWWREASLSGRIPRLTPAPPRRRWTWDRVGLDHTDPAKVANALVELHNSGFLLDKDIQEEYYNRDVNDWRRDYEDERQFRKKFEPDPAEQAAASQNPLQRNRVGSSNGRSEGD